MFTNCALIGGSVHMRVTSLHGRRVATCHIPEKSGLPSAARGEGAARSGFPFANRGVPGVGWFSHWPYTTPEENNRKTAARQMRMTVILFSLARKRSVRL